MKRRAHAPIVFVFVWTSANEPNVIAFDPNTTIRTMKWMKLLKCGLIRAPIVPTTQFGNFCRHIFIRRLQIISRCCWRRDLGFFGSKRPIVIMAMTKGSVLITGGAGYIGSHTMLAFRDAGYAVTVLDDLSTGFRSAVPSDAYFVEGNAGDQSLVSDLIREREIAGVVHFAGSIVVPESVRDPLKYYRNNTGVSRNLIEACVDGGVRSFIFSSTAAVYGIPDKSMITESAPTQPINPYGNSKLMIEWILKDTAAVHDLNYAALRYFNVAGADPQGRAGQSTENATHLLKIACQVALGRRSQLEIFGTDYDTRDGTCIRDYIHVTDLADAHLRAFEYLRDKQDSLILNCGYGHGTTVREAIAAVKKVSKVDFPVCVAPRRRGDPPALVADNTRILEILNWQPRFNDTEFIVRTALDWENQLADT